eukprot:Sdes_comp21792_c0_seq1m20358
MWPANPNKTSLKPPKNTLPVIQPPSFVLLPASRLPAIVVFSILLKIPREWALGTRLFPVPEDQSLKFIRNGFYFFASILQLTLFSLNRFQIESIFDSFFFNIWFHLEHFSLAISLQSSTSDPFFFIIIIILILFNKLPCSP